jgi:hypothetical protein
VIEDCAQSIGGQYKGKKLGSFTLASVLSFYASKVITSGDGGMVLTDDERLIRKIRDFRYYGHKHGHRVVARNYHLTNLPASLGLAQMKRLDSLVRKRRRLAAVYDRIGLSPVTSTSWAQESILPVSGRSSTRDQRLRGRESVRLGHKGLHGRLSAAGVQHGETLKRVLSLRSIRSGGNGQGGGGRGRRRSSGPPNS